jgi:hypothetical protein
LHISDLFFAPHQSGRVACSFATSIVAPRDIFFESV